MGTVGNNQSQGIPVTNQLTLSLEPSLDAHRDVRECFAACVYRNGLKRVAAELDVQPSHLSEGLSGARNLDVALIEKYVEKFRDVTPILFLCARYLRDSSDRQAAAIEQLHVLMRRLAPVMEAAGLTQAPVARRSR